MLDKHYDHALVEQGKYENWKNKGYFEAGDKNKQPFSLVIPPPNVTGKLHLGHVMDTIPDDIIARYKRMKGYDVLWVPGMDHAGIATQAKVEAKLREQGISRYDLGREKFVEEVWKWKNEYANTIHDQWAKIGLSVDYTRERFTLDEGLSNAVKHVFVTLYNEGLIYQGERIINWDPELRTALSNIEVIHSDDEGEFFYFKYDVVGTDKQIIVATTRPETMFGDTAVFVNPKDERYKDLIGKKVINPANGEELPLMGDSYVDIAFGTGAMKCTPAHDPNDFALAKKYGFPLIKVLDETAHMNKLAGKYEGMDRYECRKAWVQELKDAGYLVKIEDLTIPVGKCYRCHTVVEPRISDQWFVAMKTLAEPAIKAAESEGGELVYVPKRYEKTYLNWLYDIHDWCISRQLWWGHRIPAYYCDDCGEIVVDTKMPEVCPKCGGKHFHQDEDVLDTWFSSALWPFSTLGWPEKTPELDYFYPNDVMVTGYDIIFFWVVRMVFSGLYTMGEIPFKYVYIHGLVRDEQGRKMSKSLGNGIDPLEVINEVGADALRFMLATGISPGNDMRFIRAKLESARNFANKLWNASRFTIMNLQGENGEFLPMADEKTAVLRDEDKWILSKINEGVKEITSDLEKFETSLAGQKIYELIWDVYCDWYIELVKGRLYGDDEEDKKTARFVLQKTLKDLLRLLHPYMPFITEEIWSYLPAEEKTADNPEGLLIRDKWPEYDASLDYSEAAARIETAMEIIKAVRAIRVEADAAPSRKVSVIVRTDTLADTIPAVESHICKIANVDSITAQPASAEAADDVMSQVITGGDILVPLDELVDKAAEIERLEKEKKRLEGEVMRVEKKLANQGFVSKAPAAVVEEERSKGEKYKEMLETVVARLESLR